MMGSDLYKDTDSVCDYMDDDWYLGLLLLLNCLELMIYSVCDI